MLPECTFYIQAGKEIGLGHLIRSKNIIDHLRKENIDIRLMMEKDDFINPILINLEIHTSRVKKGSGPLIIDAINLSNITDNIILSYNPRILISPVFDRFELITHFLTRNLDPGIVNKIPSRVKIEVDPLYFFTTTAHLRKKILDFKELNIGICISGSNNYVNIKDLLSVITKLKNVTSVKIIDQYLEPNLQLDNIDINFSNFEKYPWKYFHDINVFIGGEGIMLSEALSQNIPAISMCRKKLIGKNKNLVSSGLLKTIELSQNWKDILFSILDNKELLNDQYETLKALRIPKSTPLMVEKIKKIIFN